LKKTIQRGYLAANQSATPPPASTAGQSACRATAANVWDGIRGRPGGGVITAPSANGTPAAALGQARGPMAQGIRPIRIDIPRTGQKFTFTKVLNVGE